MSSNVLTTLADIVDVDDVDLGELHVCDRPRSGAGAAGAAARRAADTLARTGAGSLEGAATTFGPTGRGGEHAFARTDVRLAGPARPGAH